MRPTSEELNKVIWYRIYKIAAILIIVGAFISPWVTQKPNSYLFFDGAINVLIYVILLYVVRAAILYIIYGKKEGKPFYTKDWFFAIVLVFFLIGVVYLMVYFFSNTSDTSNPTPKGYYDWSKKDF